MVEKVIKIGSLIVSFSLLIFFLVRFNMIQFNKSPLDLEKIKKEDSEIYELVDKTISEIESKKIKKIKTVDSLNRIIKLKISELNNVESEYERVERNKKMLSEEIDILNSKLKKISEKNDKMLLETLELTKENKELKNELSTVEIIDIVPITLVDTFYKVDTIYIKDTIYLNKKDLKKINR